MKWFGSLGAFIEKVGRLRRGTIALLGLIVAVLALILAALTLDFSPTRQETAQPPITIEPPPIDVPPSNETNQQDAAARSDQCELRQTEIRQALREKVVQVGRMCMLAPQVEPDPRMTCSEREGVLSIQARYRLYGIRNDTNSIIQLCYRRAGPFDAAGVGYSLVAGDFAEFCEQQKHRGRPALRNDC